MMISVIIPCYNVDQYIAKCIESVLAQTYKDIEIICVDNNSTDSTWEMLLQIEKKHNNIILLKEAKKGASHARKKGFDLAKGDFIQFLDADDIIHPEKFEKQLATFTENIDVVVSDRTVKNIDLTKEISVFTFEQIEKNPLETAITKIIITGNPLYRKRMLDKINGYNPVLKMAQDWDLHIRLALAEARFTYLPGIYFISRQVPDSLSSDWVKVSIQDADLIIDLKSQLERSIMMNESIRQHLSQIYFNSAIFCSDKFQSEKFVDELKYWAQNNYLFIRRPVKRAFARLFGIEKLVKILRIKRVFNLNFIAL